MSNNSCKSIPAGKTNLNTKKLWKLLDLINNLTKVDTGYTADKTYVIEIYFRVLVLTDTSSARRAKNLN